MTLLVLLGICFLDMSCQDVATTWSTELRSPDGRWLATARSQQWGGPGTAYDATGVYLKAVGDTQPEKQVLGFSHQYVTMNLKMEWLAPNHLSVTYFPNAKPGDDAHLDFALATYKGIEISVSDASSGAGKNLQ